MAKEEQIKTSIDLTGEKEYRAACTNINSSLREIGSEMKLTTAEFADNADSVEALTAKQKLLQKQFDEQAKKAEAAEKALKKMRDNGIEPTNPAYQKMQTNLNNTKADMVKIQKEIDDTSKKLKSSKVDWESVGETVGKAGKAIGAACAAMGAAIAAAGAAFFGLAEETREARENMGKLETSFTTAGHSAEDAKNTYTELYGVLGDDGQATEAAAHLAKLTTNEKELSDWTNICTGVYATFGDSLPIEGLTEAANETAKTGSITGNLADALNWAGVSEDDFQASLDACTSEQERQALITSTLNGLYSEAADKYREVNGDIIDAQKATANLNSAMAALGAIAEPIITKLKQLAAELLQEITPFVELIGKGLTGALSGAESAAEDFTDGLLGMVTFAIEKLTEMLPTFLEYAIVKQTCTNAGAARNIPNFSISTTDADTGSGQIDYTSEQYANAQLAAETAAKAAKLGIRVLTNARTGKHTFSVYEGRDLTAGNTAGNAPCIFSQEFDNIVEQEYTNSVENLKTTAYVGGEEKEGVTRKVAEVGGSSTGLSRDEVFINATDIVQEYENESGQTVTLTNAQYLALLSARGVEELEQYAETLAFGSKINTNANLKYGTDYDLGDRVTCINKRWNVRIDVRITEIAETYETSGEEIDITFGESLPALLTQIRQITK